MEPIVKQLRRFDKGITNYTRDTREGFWRMITGFDATTDPFRLVPHYSSESGDDSATTSRKQNFCIAETSGTSYLFSLGVKSGANTAEVLRKALTTGGSDDLSDDGWASPANNQAASGLAIFDLFAHYKKTGKIYLVAGQYVQAFDAASSGAYANTEADLAATVLSATQGIVHSADDNFYFAYRTASGSFVAVNDNGSWTVAALTLPRHLEPTQVVEYGNYVTIFCQPVSGIGRSIAFLWDRDSSLATISETIDWGMGSVRVAGVVNGQLIGVSLDGATQYRNFDRISFRVYTGASGSRQFRELRVGTSSLLPKAKQVVDNRLYFMMSVVIDGVRREGQWSLTQTDDGSFGLFHERTPNNDTALSSGILYNFIIVGDYVFQAYNTANTFAVSKTNDQAVYTATSSAESTKIDGGDGTKQKDLIGVAVLHDALPADGQIVLKYKKNSDSSWTTIKTNTTDDSMVTMANSIAGDVFPSFYDIQFRIESTGGAVPIGLEYACKLKQSKPYST